MSEENDLNKEKPTGFDPALSQESHSNSDREDSDQAKQEAIAADRYAELNDKYLRLHAEFDNFRKRTNKEKIDIISTANAGILKDLLPVLDDFERGINTNETIDDVEIVKEGFNLIFNKFRGILIAKGLKPMDSTGETFDVEIHEAIANVPAPKKKQQGKVIEVLEKGYYLNDKVIRFAKVVVGQ